MWHFVCNSCGLAVRVYGSLEEYKRLIDDHQQWAKGKPCFTSGCAGQLEVAPAKALDSAARVVTLDPQQFFRALCGGGTPEELQAAPEIIRAFLLSASITGVDLRNVPQDGRTVIDRIHLDNGVTLHLTGTGFGAMVFKVTRDGTTSYQVGVQQDTENNALQRSNKSVRSEGERTVGEADVQTRVCKCPHGTDAEGAAQRAAGLQDGCCVRESPAAGESIS